MSRAGGKRPGERSWKLTDKKVYIVSLYRNLGVTGGIPLVLGAAYVTVATASNFCGAILLDKVGRKPLFSASHSCSSSLHASNLC